MNLQFKHKITGEIISGDMIFINKESDGGSASIHATLDRLENTYEIISPEIEARDEKKRRLLDSGIDLFDAFAEGSLSPEEYNNLDDLYKTLRKRYLGN